MKCHRDFEDVHNDTPRKAYKEVPPQKRFEPINFDPRCVNFDFFSFFLYWRCAMYVLYTFFSYQYVIRSILFATNLVPLYEKAIEP